MFEIRSLAPAVTASSPTPRHIQLTHAAQQFEAVMIGELMKPLQNSSAIGEEEDGSSSSLQRCGVEAMAGALAKSGALGFASKMVRSVETHEAKITPREQSLETR